jgi:flagellar protein FlaJ
VFLLFFTVFSFFFLIVKNPLFIAVPKALVMGTLMGLVTFILFYMYPSIKARSRERNINTNLPFAINHVSAVAGSGVPPTNMFKLLVESQEYGEVAVELGKIVEYIELFGYDMLTAIRSVSLTVPSAPLKEFLEGIVSTVESGSELKDYLKSKASEAMLAYELERQKYLETIATYSDVYTGILIAAPLFFVVSLSLVGMLGGKLGGMDINIVIVMGAYVIIPIMNVIFLLFIEMTQPEV